jgi:hypothetical protein
MFHVWVFYSYRKHLFYYVVVEEKTGLVIYNSGYCVSHLFLAPPVLFLVHKKTDTL